MRALLVTLSLVWPLALAGATASAAGGGSGWAAFTYGVASRICHQRPERSFHTAETKWPVCARCSGLYLAAPIGAIIALGAAAQTSRRWLAIAALPTALTWSAEWAGLLDVSNLARCLAALPLGAAIAFTLVRVVSPRT